MNTIGGTIKVPDDPSNSNDDFSDIIKAIISNANVLEAIAAKIDKEQLRPYAFREAVSIKPNTYVTIKHGLGRVPIVQCYGTVGNVNPTFQIIDSNNIRVYNSNGGNNTFNGYVYCW